MTTYSYKSYGDFIIYIYSLQLSSFQIAILLQIRFDHSDQKVRYCGSYGFSYFYNSGSQPFR